MTMLVIRYAIFCGELYSHSALFQTTKWGRAQSWRVGKWVCMN